MSINVKATFKSALLFFLLVQGFSLNAQVEIPQVKITYGNENQYYIKFTGLSQVWLRHTEMNPGTTIYGTEVSSFQDIGIRRLRFQTIAQLTDKIFFYAQFGQNNFSFKQPRYTGSFFHDAVTEYRVHETQISLGAGLTGWSGLARYASPSVGSFLTLDAPLFLQATNGVNEQFLRKLSLYAKGQLGGLDYRIAITRPMATQNSTATLNTLNDYSSDFNTLPAKFQYQGYFKYQFFDHESNTTPYAAGTYLGKKKVFNIGAGFIQQSDALWKLDAAIDTVLNDMLLAAVDLFLDLPLSDEKGTAFTFYGVFTHYDFGANYLRNIGVMNPGTGVNASGTINGTGDNFPMIGSGNTIYVQTGFAFGNNIINEGGKLQPYAATQVSNYKALAEPMIMIEGGLNWYIHGSAGSKISINYQNRPVFEATPNSKPIVTSRKGMVQLQYQISF